MDSIFGKFMSLDQRVGQFYIFVQKKFFVYRVRWQIELFYLILEVVYEGACMGYIDRDKCFGKDFY